MEIRSARRPAARRVGTFERLARVWSSIVGAPDYERYLAHMGRAHAGEPALTPQAFERERLRDRFARPGNRCC
ncbi:MAG TPA: YbdD/YjiX family protein [Gemmatimonadaceae bacterium]|nr:YbdD/YjiX family protein [Gemmatimonadaceae bacterium]